LKEFDIIIIGASFAGLSFANEIAYKGFTVLVVDKKDITQTIHPTTGLLGPASIRVMNISQDLILNKIDDFKVEISDSTYNFKSRDPRYFIVNADKYIQQQYKRCLNKDIVFDFNFAVKNIIRKNSKIILKSFTDKLASCKFVVIADGAESKSMSQLNIQNNNITLTGVEHIFKNNQQIKNISIKLDYDLSPGYVSWMVPHGNDIAIGTASAKSKFNNSLIENVISHYKKQLNLTDLELINKKGGSIPVGGIQKDIIGRDYIVIGDAGGFCGPVLANGIYTAFYTGKIGAQIVGEYLQKEDENILNQYIDKTKYLKKHLFVRKLFNKLNSNEKFDSLSKIFDTPSGKKVLQQLMFKLPRDIKSMLKLIFRLLSNPKNILYLIKIAT